jgi:hypothetical protein
MQGKHILIRQQHLLTERYDAMHEKLFDTKDANY